MFTPGAGWWGGWERGRERKKRKSVWWIFRSWFWSARWVLRARLKKCLTGWRSSGGEPHCHWSHLCRLLKGLYLKIAGLYIISHAKSKSNQALVNIAGTHILSCVFFFLFAFAHWLLQGGRYLDSTSSGSSSRSQSPLLLSPAGSQNVCNSSGAMLRSLR